MMRPQTDNVPVASCSELFFGVLFGLVACLLISLSSCKAGKTVTEYVEKPVIVTQEHHTESVKIDVIRDTLVQRDSIYHYIKGDTTIIERWHYLQGSTKVVYKDTLRVRDSIPYPVVTEKYIRQEVEVNRLTWLQKLFIYVGLFSIVTFLLWLAWRVGKRKIGHI